MPGLEKTRVLSAGFLAGGDLTFTQTKNNVVVKLPDQLLDNINTVIVLELDKEAASLEPIEVE